MKNRPNWLERLFLLYILLAIYEGVLRKWILPDWSTALLLIRDPIAVAILVLGWRRVPDEMRAWNVSITLLCVATIGVALIQCVSRGANAAELLAAIYGVRTYWLHMPLAAIFVALAKPDTIARIFRIFAFSSVVMLVLMTAQYLAPAEGYLNRGAGGAENVLLGVAFDRVRVAGTFSYSTGPSCFFPLTLAIGIIGLVRPQYLSSRWALASIICSIAAIPVSGSRTLVFLEGVVALFSLPMVFANRGALKTVSITAAAVSAAVSLMLFTEIGQLSIESFKERWIDAAEVEASGNLGLEVLFGRIEAIVFGSTDNIEDVPLLGHGIGIGTNVGAQLTTGSVSFLLAEYEWARIVQECGPLLGAAILAWRVCTALFLAVVALRPRWGGWQIAITMCGVSIPNIIFGHIQQATVLGFVSISLMLTFGLVRVECNRSPTGFVRRHTRTLSSGTRIRLVDIGRKIAGN